jgi:tRNA (guanine-N7-)-methyltransferase
MVRPKNIAPPYARNNPIIVIHDRVWYIPPLADVNSFLFPGWTSPILFGNDNPVCVEFCSGNGDWIIEQAIATPTKNWLAVEKRFDRVRKIWSKITNRSVTNLVAIYGEGARASTSFFPTESVEKVFVNFPDPWPKNRHAKNRLISVDFLTEVARILKNQGSFTFVTDDQAYSELFLRLPVGELRQMLPHPGFAPLPQGYGSSFFASLFISQGKPIYYHLLKKSRPL